MRKLVYQPEGFSIGDAMPFYENGCFYFYHYKHKTGTQGPQNWTLTTTPDFIHFTDHGELFKHGKEDEQDYIFRSGTLLKIDDVYHFFYGGDNIVECLLHAYGTDIKNLHKDKFRLPIEPGYGPTEWRDPYVSWCDEINAYILILGTRKIQGEKFHNGCTVWFTSIDLVNWIFKGDFWAPDQYTTHEMPDLFKIGDWWYLLISEYSDNTQVIYRRSKSISGPWELASSDALDGCSYFAGRTVADDKGRRFLCGWICGKFDRNDRAQMGLDNGMWHHQVYQENDGSLGVKIPEPIYQAFNERRSLISHEEVLVSPFGRKEDMLGNISGSHFMVEAIIEAGDANAFSINLLENKETGEAYEYKFFIPENRFMMSRTPNHGIVPPDHFRGMEKLYRNCQFTGKKEIHIQIIYDDTFVIAYINGTALSGRFYSQLGESVSVAVFNGQVKIKEFYVREGLKI